jgi:hypothetical protein
MIRKHTELHHDHRYRDKRSTNKRYTVKKRLLVLPSPAAGYYALPGRVWLVTSRRLGTGKPLTFFYSECRVYYITETNKDIMGNLKGHGNEADFLGFLHKPVWHRSLTLRFEPFRFWLRIRRDIRNRKTTPRLAESGSQQDCL